MKTITIWYNGYEVPMKNAHPIIRGLIADDISKGIERNSFGYWAWIVESFS